MFNFNVIYFCSPWNVSLVPVTSEWTEIKKNTTSREEHQWFIVWQCASDSNLDLKIKYTDFFKSKKEEYHYHAQVDFDFGQVHIVWWLSYCQVEEKISVEPCAGGPGVISPTNLSNSINPNLWTHRSVITEPHKGQPLIHGGQNKVAGIQQTTFSNAFSVVKFVICWCKCH